MRVILGSRETGFASVQYLHNALLKHGIASKAVMTYEIVARLPTKSISGWLRGTRRFRRLVADFKPDVVFTNALDNFALASINAQIPTVINLRGDVWSEYEWAKEEYSSFIQRRVLAWRHRTYEECLRRATAIWSVSNYLDRIAKSKLPGKQTMTFMGCIIDTDWTRTSPNKLKHPCVGILQKATILGKINEMKVLREVIPKFPNVTFYWAGSGNIEYLVRGWLDEFPNFVRLGSIPYPEGVRDFLSEVDIMAQVTGVDMLARSLLEAQSVGTPVLATNVGGCSESVIDGKTGHLVRQGDPADWCDKIEMLLQDRNLCASLGKAGRRHIREKFSPDKGAREFIQHMSALLA